MPATRCADITAPIRTCIGCRRRAPQSELVRFVADTEGNVIEGRMLSGRGAWLCKDTLTACRALAERRRAFPRALRLTGGSSRRR